MDPIRVCHNPACSKSRGALKTLDERNAFR